MKASGFFKDVDARTEIEMICIAEDYLGLHIFPKFVLVDRLYTSQCPYRHKYRCLYRAVVSSYKSGACITARRGG